MRILAIDVGTGTQDILLFDSTQPVENALQMIMPSPRRSPPAVSGAPPGRVALSSSPASSPAAAPATGPWRIT